MRFLIIILLTGLTCGAPLDTFLTHPSLKTASVGIHITTLDGKETIISHNPDLGLIPASTLKIVTTATALQLLGPDFTFKTRLYLSGDYLIIKGGGDPTLSASGPAAEFPAWLAALKKAGLSELKGDLLADPSRFESRTVPNDWPWGDIGNYYGSGPSGLNYFKNTYLLTFLPGTVSKSAKLLSTFPTPPGVTFENHMLTGSPGSGDQGYVYAAPRGKIISMRGTIPSGGKFTIKGSLPDPPLSCATAFRDYLVKNDFPVHGKIQIKATDPNDSQLIHTQNSPPLSKIIKGTNHRSVNLYADSIFKILTTEGTTSASVTKIKSHWAKQGVNMTGFVAHDGSGLAPRNTITARQLAAITQKASTGEHHQIFRDSLPVAGRSGTMATFGNGTPVAGLIRAKSGSLTRVRTYAGLLTTLSGETYTFAILTNNTITNAKPAIVEFLKQVIKGH